MKKAIAVVIFDIDATLADCAWRLHHIHTEGKKKNWKAFYEDSIRDEVYQNVLDHLHWYRNAGFKIIICTARNSHQAHKVTVEWLEKNNIPYDELYMRSKNDFRPSHECKEHLLQKMIEKGYSIYAAYDDDEDNVKMYIRNGIFTFQIPRKEMPLTNEEKEVE